MQYSKPKEKANKGVSSQRNFGVLALSTDLGHYEEIRVVKFPALALRSYRNVSSRFDEGRTFETSALESVYSGQITLSLTQLMKPKIRKAKVDYFCSLLNSFNESYYKTVI